MNTAALDAVPALRWTRDADLGGRTSFRVPARAAWLVEVADASALPAALADPRMDRGPLLPIGGGSNLLFAGPLDGVALALTGAAARILEDDGERVLVRAEAGHAWHDFVLRTLSLGLSGLENLALIPGTVGAAPIQNIGAYGVELDRRIHAVEAWDREAGALVRLAAGDCGFAYRDSRFKREPSRWVVTAVEFALARTPRLELGYAGIGRELADMGIDIPTPAQVADAVCRIRRRKLPDPAVLGNAGSFFKNPIVAQAQADALASTYPDLPCFAAGPGLAKLSAAWLIDAAGWKGHRDGDAGVAPGHALVLVNHGRATGEDLLALARRIADSVQARFGVALEPEPRIVGATW
ncbi:MULTISPECIES: UDP-N-acetylmuramate dehydrogenase [unclassified Luteimonas]|uniref:UDP-N-acetylmuramate dehydrogenase n=1 Tax=unclassified Luteimonas TaxID=2629088 RepID=UPI001F37B609|nr:UDP-N-acetylmuramate dehydrogenase [Luteimonas sp. MC1750]